MHSISNILLLSVLLFGFVVPLFGAQCTGDPPTYNGLPCATTTRYWDGQEGACGCGDSSGPFSWSYASYTAAGSDKLFGAGSTWCGSGCGSCYELTPTGDCTTPSSDCATSTDSIVVMVTNLCPYSGNEEWCPESGDTNTWGYGAHFDLMDYNMDGLISALGWNNPVVTYKQVACGSNGSPTCTDAAECVCTNAETGCTSSSSSSSSTTSNTTKTTTSTTASSTSTTASSSTSTTSSTSAATTSSSTSSSTTKQGSTSTTGSSSNTESSSSSCSSSSISITQTTVGSWQSGSSTVTQYNVVIASTCSGKTLTALTLSATEWSSVINSWNVAATLSGTSATLTLPSWLSVTSTSALTIGYQTTSSQVAFTVTSYTFA